MHAKAILNNLRSLFGEAKLTRERVDLNSLSLEVLKTLRPESQPVSISKLNWQADCHPFSVTKVNCKRSSAI